LIILIVRGMWLQ